MQSRHNAQYKVVPTGEQAAEIIPQGDKMKIIFDEPQRSVTPGQSAVIYDGDTVIGGGRIIEAIK